jgi:hypothetical protein
VFGSAQVRLAHAHLVDERAVRQVIVDEHVAGVVLHDPAVVARHRVVVEHDVVVFHRADPHFLFVEHPLLRRIIDGLQHAPPQVQGRPSVEIADLGRRNEVQKLLHEARAPRHHSPKAQGFRTVRRLGGASR